jgi:ParB/RepB/Spo0J family partition protein
VVCDSPLVGETALVETALALPPERTCIVTETIVEDVEVATAAARVEDRFTYLPIADVKPSKTNPRQHFSETYLADLAGSIREHGMLEPIIVRPVYHDDGIPYEIVAGECRYRASKLAELSELPAIVRPYSDEQALEVQLIENLHRTDLRPLEQARGFRRLIDSNPTKHSAESIGARLGMSPSWVWDRMKLLDLVPAAQQLVEEERISAGHAILVARLKSADQVRVIDPDKGGLWKFDGGRIDFDEEADEAVDERKSLKPASIRELESWITDHVRFDVKHAAAAVPLEFEELAERVEEAEAKPGRGKKVIAISYSSQLQQEARDENERTYCMSAWRRADGKAGSKTCEHSVLGVVATGAHYGEAFDVCVAREKCTVHYGDVIRQKERAAKLRESGKADQATKTEARAETDWKEEERKRQEAYDRWKQLRPHAFAACAAKIRPTPLTDKVLAGVIDRALDDGYVARPLFYKFLGTKAVTKRNFTRALALCDVLSHGNTREYFQAEIAKGYGVDLNKLEKLVLAKAKPQASATADKPAAKPKGRAKRPRR